MEDTNNNKYEDWGPKCLKLIILYLSDRDNKPINLDCIQSPMPIINENEKLYLIKTTYFQKS